MGSMVFVLLTPLSHWAWFGAYVGASVLRGLLVGVGVFIVTLYFAIPEFTAPLWILVFGLLGAALLGTLGLIAGLWADKFDQMAAFQNFLIMPMTFLSGVFYSIQSLPPFLAKSQPSEPVFLHDRRFPLRLLRPERRVALGQPGDCRLGLAGGQRAGGAPAAYRLQDPQLRPSPRCAGTRRYFDPSMNRGLAPGAAPPKAMPRCMAGKLPHDCRPTQGPDCRRPAL
jgi:hypothetical protein